MTAHRSVTLTLRVVREALCDSHLQRLEGAPVSESMPISAAVDEAHRDKT